MEITTKNLCRIFQINLPAFYFQALIPEEPFRKTDFFFIKIIPHSHQILCLINRLSLVSFSL